MEFKDILSTFCQFKTSASQFKIHVHLWVRVDQGFCKENKTVLQKFVSKISNKQRKEGKAGNGMTPFPVSAAISECKVHPPPRKVKGKNSTAVKMT